ncbi:MAG TPA: hypothetical protein VK716_16125 [Terracidiphilus sp.]|nr:hypothetical protein [Terracidiphilus sp.]
MILKRQHSDDGYMLVAVMFLLAILVLSMAVAVPRIKASIQRDREVETMHRGKQYARAIKLYYKKFSAYPPNIDALVMTNQTRFLRKRYKDPITGKDDWKPIMFGQNKAPLAMGFFGQPLGGMAGSTLAGTGPSGGNGMTGASSFGGSSIGSSMNSSFGSGSSSSGGAFSNSGSTFGQDSSGQAGSNGVAGANGQNGASGGSGSSGGGSSDGSLSSTQTFGGGGIIGFRPESDKQSILFYKKKNHYNEWEFTYSPQADQMINGGNAGSIGQPAGGTDTSIGGFGNTNQNGNGGSIFNSNGSGSSGGSNPGGTTNSPTAPTTPQQ